MEFKIISNYIPVQRLDKRGSISKIFHIIILFVCMYFKYFIFVYYWQKQYKIHSVHSLSIKKQTNNISFFIIVNVIQEIL